MKLDCKRHHTEGARLVYGCLHSGADCHCLKRFKPGTGKCSLALNPIPFCQAGLNCLKIRAVQPNTHTHTNPRYRQNIPFSVALSIFHTYPNGACRKKMVRAISSRGLLSRRFPVFRQQPKTQTTNPMRRRFKQKTERGVSCRALLCVWQIVKYFLKYSTNVPRTERGRQRERGCSSLRNATRPENSIVRDLCVVVRFNVFPSEFRRVNFVLLCAEFPKFSPLVYGEREMLCFKWC